MGEFLLTAESIPAAAPTLDLPEAGSLVSFTGIVRNHHEGKKVLALEYEIFGEMAQAEAQRILAEAAGKFPLIDVRGAHRYGRLEVGEVAVVVHVWTAHRGEGFAACRWLIDEIKSRLPIWKHEYYADGTAAWVACHHGHETAVI